MDNLKKIESKIIVFIPGAFVAANCWDDWKTFFDARGYKCVVIPWPNKCPSVSTLRARSSSEAIAGMRLTTLIEYYARQIQLLNEKPILVGHSMGGLITQLLLQQSIVAAGVAIHPVAPPGSHYIQPGYATGRMGTAGFFYFG